jgi:hypothetical protein
MLTQIGRTHGPDLVIGVFLFTYSL